MLTHLCQPKHRKWLSALTRSLAPTASTSQKDGLRQERHVACATNVGDLQTRVTRHVLSSFCGHSLDFLSHEAGRPSAARRPKARQRRPSLLLATKMLTGGAFCVCSNVNGSFK